MNNILISVILASVLSFFIIISQSNEDTNKDKTNEYIKIFIISGICIYVGLLYFGSSSSDIKYIIKGGTPPF